MDADGPPQFAGASDGSNPETPRTLDRSGVLYGTTQNAGNDAACNMGEQNVGCGIVSDVIP